MFRKGKVMSRELREKADIVIKELKELLTPIRDEIRLMRYNENTNFDNISLFKDR
jgi:hypothetical protein